MTIFDVLTMIGGLCLFLFGMNQMGESLERRAGDSLRAILGKLTSNRAAGFLTGLGVTAVIQSSSATTVMIVGFVNSGLMTLRQAINVIMGANVGTTVTAWILSLSGLESSSIFVQLFKPTSFTPILALIGIIMYMTGGEQKRKDTGTILLGFAVLMFGMDTMSGAVSGLREVEWFRNMFILFRNPVLGVLAGAVLTAVIQSSSASVGILQALSSTGQVSYGAAIPIIMGQNIGTCVTALLSSVGATKNAKRAAFVHLSFNVIGTVVWLAVFSIVDLLIHPALLDASAEAFGIAHLLGRDLAEMSAGERQMISLLRAAVQDTPVLLLDEPSSALDFNHTGALFALLKTLADGGKTILIVLHDPTLALRHASKIVRMGHGTAEDILDNRSPDYEKTEASLRMLYPDLRIHRDPLFCYTETSSYKEATLC